MEMRDGMIKTYHPYRYIQFLLFFQPFLQDQSIVIEDLKKISSNHQQRNNIWKCWKKGPSFVYGFYTNSSSVIISTGTVTHRIEGALAHGGISWWLLGYMYVYSLYLFFDFAGYSLFAVGTSYLMGYDTPINFNKPF